MLSHWGRMREGMGGNGVAFVVELVEWFQFILRVTQCNVSP